MQHPSGSSEPLTPFHVAVQVRDIAEARAFYKDILGCSEGRSDTAWVDFNLFGHQFVCHLNSALGKGGSLASHYNVVGGHGVPVPHCGVVLHPEQWSSLAERLKRMGVRFAVETVSGTSAQA
jgi:extradiol dioxygenase family protein